MMHNEKQGVAVMDNKFIKPLEMIIKIFILLLFLLILVSFGWGVQLSSFQSFSMLLIIGLIFYPKLNSRKNINIRLLIYVFILISYFPFDFLLKDNIFVFELRSYVVIYVVILMVIEYLLSRKLD